LRGVESDIDRVHPFECDDDEVAIRIALEIPGAVLLELWEGDRLVGIINLSKQMTGTS
jgi:hypothetical protein